MRKIVLTLAAALLSLAALAQTHQLDINLKKAGAPIPSTLYGIFFEDINYAADGGLYAELVKNRSFEFPCDALQGWKAFGKVEVREDGPFARNPHYVRLDNPGHPHKWTGLDNDGFFGIGLKEGEKAFVLNRIRFLNEEPFVLEYSAVPFKYFPDIADIDFAVVSLYDYMESYDLMPKEFNEKLQSIRKNEGNAWSGWESTGWTWD